MLVPGYVNPEGVKALAKLSGMNASDAKYKRPESREMQSKSALGGPNSIANGTYSTMGESIGHRNAGLHQSISNHPVR